MQICEPHVQEFIIRRKAREHYCYLAQERTYFIIGYLKLIMQIILRFKNKMASPGGLSGISFGYDVDENDVDQEETPKTPTGTMEDEDVEEAKARGPEQEQGTKREKDRNSAAINDSNAASGFQKSNTSMHGSTEQISVDEEHKARTGREKALSGLDELEKWFKSDRYWNEQGEYRRISYTKHLVLACFPKIRYTNILKLLGEAIEYYLGIDKTGNEVVMRVREFIRLKHEQNLDLEMALRPFDFSNRAVTPPPIERYASAGVRPKTTAMANSPLLPNPSRNEGIFKEPCQPAPRAETSRQAERGDRYRDETGTIETHPAYILTRGRTIILHPQVPQETIDTITALLRGTWANKN